MANTKTKAADQAPEIVPTDPGDQEVKSGPYKDFELGQPAPHALWLVMNDQGVEDSVGDKQPERGHLLVQEGERVDQHVINAINDAK